MTGSAPFIENIILVDNASRKNITYRFQLKSGEEKVFTVALDLETLALINDVKTPYPDWTELEFYKCPNCPLKVKDHPHCPIAVNLVELIEFFKDSPSFEEVVVIVETAERSYSHSTSLQKGISALMGIFMVSSGCPVMDKFRPMVDSHLPFASPDETISRMIGMYMTAQYFLHRNGQTPDLEMKNLVGVLDEVGKVDRGMAERMRSIRMRDASLNALVILNSCGESTTFSIEEDDLGRLEKIFMAHYG